MSFFQNLFKSAAPAAPKVAPPSTPAVPVTPIPPQLPKIRATSAQDICRQFEPKPAAAALLTPTQTPSQYLTVLQANHLGDEMVKTLAHGLPDREGVWWAAQCAQRVSLHLTADDLLAAQAASTWAKNPTPEAGAAAKAAADRTDYRGPGALAAQAAHWAQENSNPDSVGNKPRLAPNAVAGAVLLSSSIAASPQLAAPKFQKLNPSVEIPGGLNSPSLAVPSIGAGMPGMPNVPGVPNVSAPGLNIPGANLPSAPNLPGVNMPNIPQPSMPTAGLNVPGMGIPGQPNINVPNVNMAAPGVNIPSMNVSGMAMPSASIPGVSAPGLAIPNSPGLPGGNLPGLPNASITAPNFQSPDLKMPGMPSITLPPAVKLKMFSDQQSFIALGIDIASGKIS